MYSTLEFCQKHTFQIYPSAFIPKFGSDNLQVRYYYKNVYLIHHISHKQCIKTNTFV